MANLLQSFLIWQGQLDLRARRADFYYDLGMTLDDKIPLFTTLRKYEARARQRKQISAPLYLHILKRMQSGSLSEALKGVAADSELIMLDAVQASGDAALSSGLKFLSSTVEKIDHLKAIARKAVVYPVVMIIVFYGMLYGFAAHVVPVLSNILPPEKWPFLGKLLYATSTTIQSYGHYIFAGFVATALLFVYSLPRWTGAVRRRLDPYPPWVLYRDFSGAMLIVSLSTLMRSGVSLRSSLERALRYSSPWLAWHIREILTRLSRPNSSTFGEAFQTGVVNQYLEDRIQDAAERRNPVEAFVKIGVGSIDRLAASIEASASKLNSALLVICGLILGLMMGGFFATAMELQSGIAQQNSQISK
jgi:type II secretory pathway component PulF